MNNKWKVQLRGGFDEEDDEGSGYELSVIKKDNKHGQLSWGWGGEDKIILFGTGIGENQAEDSEFALLVANKLCDALNKIEITKASSPFYTK